MLCALLQCTRTIIEMRLHPGDFALIWLPVRSPDRTWNSNGPRVALVFVAFCCRCKHRNPVGSFCGSFGESGARFIGVSGIVPHRVLDNGMEDRENLAVEARCSAAVDPPQLIAATPRNISRPRYKFCRLQKSCNTSMQYIIFDARLMWLAAAKEHP